MDAAIERCVARAVAAQDPWLDLLDPGRIDEDDPVRAAARRLRGCNLEAGLDLPVEWIAEAPPPVLMAPPELADRRVHRRRWQAAQRWTAKPVKLQLLGPLSLARGLDDRVYGGDVGAAATALADALNPALRDLAEAGCPAVEVVEPCLAVAGAVQDNDLEALARLFHKVPADMFRWLRAVAGDGAAPWQASPASDLALLSTLAEDLPLDGVVAEAAAALAEAGPIARWRRLAVGLLAVPAEARGPDSAEQAAAWLIEAAGRLEPHRLVAAVDGGGGRATVPLATRMAWLEQARAAVTGLPERRGSG